MDPKGIPNFKSLSLKDSLNGTISSNGATKPSDWSARYTVPCKYYKLGTCKLGDQCRFSHTKDPTDPKPYTVPKPRSLDVVSTSSSSSNSNEEEISEGGQGEGQEDAENNPVIRANPPNKTGRRPYLQIVVLFAADVRVMRYAKEVHTAFLENGVDAYLQTEETGQHIKTENLAEVITNSKADCLIVIGDRNMKNRSCQAKRRGKLVEMDVDEMIKTVWAEWELICADNTDEEVDDNDKLSEDQIHALLSKYTQLRFIKDRLSRIRVSNEELKDWKYPKSRSGFDGPVPALTQELANKLTAAQQHVIRLHQQLAESLDSMRELSAVTPEAATQTRRGEIKGPDYDPADLRPGISESLKERLINEIKKLLPKVEALGAQMSEFGTPLWDAYKNEYHRSLKSQGGPAPVKTTPKQVKGATAAASPTPGEKKSNGKPTAGGWNCSVCTFLNEGGAAKCIMCESAKPSAAPTEDEWNLTGVAGKNQRKKQKAKREAEKKQQEEEEQRKQKEAEEKKRLERLRKAKEEQEKAQQQAIRLRQQQQVVAPKVQQLPPKTDHWHTQHNNGATDAVKAPIVSPFIPQGPQGRENFPSLSNLHTRAGHVHQPQVPQQPITIQQPTQTQQQGQPQDITAQGSRQDYNFEHNFPSLSSSPEYQNGLWNKKLQPPSQPSHVQQQPTQTQHSMHTMQQLQQQQQLLQHLHQQQLHQQQIHQLQQHDQPSTQQNPPAQSPPRSPTSQQAQQSQLQQPLSLQQQASQKIKYQQQQPQQPQSTFSSTLNPQYKPFVPQQQQQQQQQLLLQQQQQHLQQQQQQQQDYGYGLWTVPNASNTETFQNWMNAFSVRASPYAGLSYDSPSQSSFFGAGASPNYYQAFPQSSLTQPAAATSLSQSQPTSSSSQPATQQQEQEQFDKDRYKAREQVLLKYRNSAQQPQRPCCYCGEESVLECNLCAKTGYATYFCSIEHQTLMWKEHMRVHQAYIAANK